MNPLVSRALFLPLALAAASVALGDAPKIGVLNKGRGIVWAKTEEGYRQAAEELGVELILKVPPTATAVSAQLKLLEVIAREPIDALVVAPIDPERLAEPVKALAQRGVKVVVVDTALPEGIGLTFVSHDQQGMAKAAATAGANLLAEGDEVAVLRFAQTDRAMVERESHLLRHLKSLRPNARIAADVYASSGEKPMIDQARTLLQKHPAAKLVITTSFGATKAMVRLIQERNLATTVNLVGFGVYLPEEMAKAIEDGSLDVWIAQQPKDLGLLSVKAAAALVRSDSVPAVIHSKFTVVTKANLNEAGVQELQKEAVLDPAAQATDLSPR